jgi:hypothetical protein
MTVMEMRTGRIPFGRGTGDREGSKSFFFPRKIVAVHVVMTGYDARFADQDHHIRSLTLDLSARFLPRPDSNGKYRAIVTGRFNLRDDGGNPSFGRINFVLFVEFQGLLPPTARKKK